MSCAFRSRYNQIAVSASGTETTIYVGGILEKVSTASGTAWRHYLPAGSVEVVHTRWSTGLNATRYLATDHLGSADAIIDSAGAVLAQLSFAAYGARRGAAMSGTPSSGEWSAIASTSRHGYTGHEALDNIGLVHMNGRVYDPAVGRFVSVDPIIGDLADSQSVNPFAYVGNRPLSWTDPTGLSGEGVCAASGPYAFACAIAVNSVVNYLFSWLTGSSPPPPPPATSLPGISAQDGVMECGPGSSSPVCTGLILYMGPAAGSRDPDFNPRVGQNGSASQSAAAAMGVLAGRLVIRNPGVLGETTLAAGVAMSVVYVLISSPTWEQLRHTASEWEYIPPVVNSSSGSSGSGTGGKPVLAADQTGSASPGDPNQFDPNDGERDGEIAFGVRPEARAHAFRHVLEKGYDADAIEQAIRQDILASGPRASGRVIGVVRVNGVDFRYSGMKFPNGLINVGRITPLPR